MSAGDLHDDAMIIKSTLLCRGALVCRKSLSLGYASAISFSPDYDNRLPIVLFVGQHFSGSLFHLITLLLFTRETTKGIRERDCRPYPCPLGFLPRGSLFPYPYPYPAGVLAKLVKLPEHCISCQCRDA